MKKYFIILMCLYSSISFSQQMKFDDLFYYPTKSPQMFRYTPLFGTNINEIANIDSIYYGNEKPVLIQLYASWCRPCHNDWAELSKIKNVIVLKVCKSGDGDSDVDPSTICFEPRFYPTYLFVYKNKLLVIGCSLDGAKVILSLIKDKGL